MIEAVGGTMLIDEADYSRTEIGSDIVKVLNSGYNVRGSTIPRMEKDEATGEFTPRAYSCFGPKVINGRQAFRDNATENRCLAYSPLITQRSDIPLQLFEEFDNGARHIRNMLLKWRFDTLESLEVDRELKPERSLGRASQIVIPLLHVLRLMSPELRAKYTRHLEAYCAGRDAQALEITKEGLEAQLVQAYVDLSAKQTDVTSGELVTAVTRANAEVDPNADFSWLKSRRVGDIMRSLRFKSHKITRGWVLSIEPGDLLVLTKKYGTTSTTSSATVIQPSSQSSSKGVTDMTVQ
jgi:hypothetical protein